MPVSAQKYIGNIGVGNTLFSDKNRVYLLYRSKESGKPRFQIDSSTDGLNFVSFCRQTELLDIDGNPVETKEIQDIRISALTNKYIWVYRKELKRKKSLSVAVSPDLRQFVPCGNITTGGKIGQIVPGYQFRDQYVFYFIQDSLKIAFSKDFQKWHIETCKLEYLPKEDKFTKIQIVGLANTPKGILVLYSVLEMDNSTLGHKLVVFDKNNPRKILFEQQEPFWQSPPEWGLREIKLLGIIYWGDRLISYWQSQEGIFAIPHAKLSEILRFKTFLPFNWLRLHKIRDNPIIKPIFEHLWESKATFNPAAFYDEGKVHLLYRAIGEGDRSVIGYATSNDGIQIDQRLDEPIFIPKNMQGIKRNFNSYSPFASGGGGYGGCEDPRITKIDDKLYMTYVHYDGWNHPRVALTSIGIDDFHKQNFHWSDPVFISSPHVIDKNACILPEKIDGKYVIFHRVFPNILIDFVDDLDFDGKSRWLTGEYSISPRSMSWDSRKVGVGPTPIKTKEGWLVIYHGVGDDDPSRYKMGAMILDINNPAKVLYRSQRPILEPTESYENEGYKYGVAYPCGAVELKEQLIVYYGGADTVVCAATAPINNFLEMLKYNHPEQLILKTVN